jgi:hypothetical protein
VGARRVPLRSVTASSFGLVSANGQRGLSGNFGAADDASELLDGVRGELLESLSAARQSIDDVRRLRSAFFDRS